MLSKKGNERLHGKDETMNSSKRIRGLETEMVEAADRGGWVVGEGGKGGTVSIWNCSVGRCF